MKHGPLRLVIMNKQDAKKPRMRVNAETVRRLSDGELRHAAAGLAKSQLGPTHCPICIAESTITGSVDYCCS
jgi:hypothetical protein